MADIFVFGSNLAGLHYGGAAAHAHKSCGAEWGEGVGRTGSAYAIPTCDENVQTLPLARIAPHIVVFIDYARNHPGLTFGMTHIGCGIAGYDWQQDISPMLPADLPANITILNPL